MALQETRTSPPTDPADTVGGAGRRSVPGDVQGVSARQKAASFTIDQALAKMSEVAGGAGH